jgi:ribosomal protein S18 acetylase RimI-like enzyme
MIGVRALTVEDAAWKIDALLREWGATAVARKGELIDPLTLDGFVALDGDDRVGLLTYDVRGDEFEVVTLQADHQGIGVGRALMDAARLRAVELGARRLWLVTTNNNVRAFGFYQRWGMQLRKVYPDGVTRSRALKRAIPLVDDEGLPIRDELEFELNLTLSGGQTG